MIFCYQLATLFKFENSDFSDNLKNRKNLNHAIPEITSNRIQTLFQGKDMKETFASSWLNQILALVRYSSTIHFFLNSKM